MTLMYFYSFFRFSDEEDSWLNNQLDHFDQVWHSVPLGEDHIREVIMFSYDVPTSKSFVRNGVSVFNERFKRIMLNHDCFSQLPQNVQSQIFQQNLFLGSALLVAKLEYIQSGSEQLFYAMGSFDRKQWKEETRSLPHHAIKKFELYKENKFLQILSEEDCKQFQHLVNVIGETVKDDTMLKLFTMVMLFKDNGINGTSELKKLQESYINVIRRKQGSIYKDVGSYGTSLGVEIYSRFQSCIKDIQKLSLLLAKASQYNRLKVEK